METKKLTCSDLMVGDWVNIYVFTKDTPQEKDLFPARVTCILSDGGNNDFDTIECVTPKDRHIASRPADACLPIPLTTEILMRNGFIKGIWGTYHLPNTEIEVEIKAYGLMYLRYSACQICEIKSVSHLQHLLRDFNVDKEIAL